MSKNRFLFQPKLLKPLQCKGCFFREWTVCGKNKAHIYYLL